MPTLTISIHAEGPPDFETTDPATVALVRAIYPEPSSLVPAHDLASILRTAGRKYWASRLEREEEASMVTARLS